MKIILLKDTAKIGRKYDIKDVAEGYALNLLIPNKLAIVATKEAVKRIEIEKAREEGEKKIHQDLILKNIDGLKNTPLIIFAKTNDKGHLFAGFHREDLAKEIEKQTKLSIDSTFIKLDNPIKEIGDYNIEINAIGKTVNLKLSVQSSS